MQIFVGGHIRFQFGSNFLRMNLKSFQIHVQWSKSHSVPLKYG